MFSVFSPARRQSKLANTKSRLLWPLRCSYLVCQVCRWFTAPRPAQTRTRSLHHAAPPADNSTGFCACTLYLVFKEPTPTELRIPAHGGLPQSFRPSLGEPSKVTTEDLLCQHPAKFFICRSFGDKKIAPTFSEQPSGSLCRVSPSERVELSDINTIHALGVGFPRPLL